MKAFQSVGMLSLAVSVLIVVTLACGGKVTTNTTTDNSTNTTASPAPSSSTSTTSSTPAPSKKSDIAGKYDATGSNPDGGGEYRSVLTVTPRDDVYQFTWVSGKNSYDGVGVLSDNEVAVSFTEGESGKGCGVALYKISGDGSMTGKTGYWGQNTLEIETAKRTSGNDLEGSYDIEGKNPKGEAYKGKLKVTQDGDGYTFNWDAGSAYSGYGIRAGEFVAVGFGGSKCSFVGYDVQADGTLAGKWGSQGSKKFGTEIAKPQK